MNYKLLIVVFSWLAAFGGLFLFSANAPQPEPQTANIIETVATPAPSKAIAPKIKPQPQGHPVEQGDPVVVPAAISNPILTPVPTSTPTPISSVIPSPTITAAPTPTPAASSGEASLAPEEREQTPIPTPSGISRHIFYTSSHWKAKYYYCDTDNGWKNLSPSYLKSFNSEAELLQNYQRILHEPCKN